MLVDRNKALNVLLCVFIYALSIYFIFNCIENKQMFKYSGYIILGLNVYMAFRNRKNTMLYLVYIVMLYFNFSFMYDLYILGKPALGAFYAQMPEVEILGKGIYLMLLFTNTLFAFDLMKKPSEIEIKNDFFYKKDNTNLIIAWIWFAFATMTGIISTQWAEYSGAIIIVAYLYGGKNKYFKIAVLIYLIWFIYTVNKTGSRIAVLNLIFVVLFFYLVNKANYKNLLLCFIAGVILMTYSGLYTDTHGAATITDAVDKLKESAGALDTCQFSYMSSQLGIKTADKIATFAERLQYFKNFLISQVVLSSSSIEDCKMCLITAKYFAHFNGQFFPHTMYFYIGWFGSIVSGIIIGLYLMCVKSLKENSNSVVKIVSIWAISMIGKWYLYEPNSLLKGTLFLLIVYGLAYFSDTIMKKSIKNNTNDEKQAKSIFQQ